MNILAIGAHFDDVELGCSGTLAKRIAEGDKVYVYTATVSDFLITSKNKNLKRLLKKQKQCQFWELQN